MIKNKLIGKIGCLLMLVWASVSLHAQSIELLGLYSNGSAGQLKAKVELAANQIGRFLCLSDVRRFCYDSFGL